MTTLALTAATPADADGVAALLARVAEGPTQTAAELRVALAEEEAWLAGDEGRPAGFLTLRLRGPDLADAELACEPGTDALLAELAETRARELGAKLLRIVPLDAGDRLEVLGYSEGRSFLRLGRALPELALPPGLERVPPTSPEVHAVEQAGFADAWGFVPETYEDWRDRVVRRFAPGPALVVRRDGEAVGVVRCTRRYDWGWIPTLAVVPAHQRQGIGALLIDGACALLAASGETHVGLEVDVGNAPARRLYVSRGFEELTRERFFEKSLR